jgi:fused signal recognition particle receptor
MFDKLKKAFSSAAKSIGSQKELSEKDLDNTLFDLQLGLLESDVAQEVIDDLCAKLKNELLGLKLEKGQVAGEVIRSKLYSTIAETFAKAGKIDLVQKIKIKAQSNGGPFVIVFLGINGTGKTTTVAKIGNLLRNKGVSVVVAAGDTHRAGAIEQLSQHAEKLSLKVIAQRYGADPSAVGRDAVDYGRKHYVEAVLIDTAGRMQTAKNLMDEIGKIVRVVKPDMKLFVGDSLAGNDTINQAREFFQYTNFDGAILTKTDADVKGGAALSIVHITSKPIVYLGMGQNYDDLIPFDSEKFLESLFGNTATSIVAEIKNLDNITSKAKEVYEPIISKKSNPEMPMSSDYRNESNITTTTTTTSTITTNEMSDAPGMGSEDRKNSSRDVYEGKEGSEQDRPPLPRTTNDEATKKIEINSSINEKAKSRFSGWFHRKKKGEKSIQDQIDGDETNEVQSNDDANENNSRKKNDSIDSSSVPGSLYLKEGKKGNEATERDVSERKDGEKKDEKIYLTDEDIEDLLK